MHCKGQVICMKQELQLQGLYQDACVYCNKDKTISTCVINTAAADGPAPVRPATQVE